VYNPNRLEWHLDVRTNPRTPEYFWWSCKAVNNLLVGSKRLLAASPRPRSPKVFGGFVFGQRNAERRWLCLRYPVTRASQSRERGRIPRARWLKQSGLVRCDDMAPKSSYQHRANFVFEHGKAVLCSNIHQKAVMKYVEEANEIAARLKKQGNTFLQSKEWKDLRRLVVKTYGRMCMKCGTTPKNPKMTHVDHIKPRKTHPELALDFDNLQVLCCRCNKAKGNKHSTDYRKLF